MAFLNEDDLPAAMDPDFLLTLDMDMVDENNEAMMVDNYDCAWWLGRKPRTLDLAGILDRSSVQNCLNVHRKQFSSSADDRHTLDFLDHAGEIEIPLTNENLSHHLSILNSSSRAPLPCEVSANKTRSPPASISTPSVLPAPISCRQCSDYSQILSNTLIDLLNLHIFSKSLMSSSETQWYMDMRRASTFNLLHEAVIIKETAGGSTGTEESSAPSQTLPPTSYKWTWGEKLTESEVLELRRSGTNPLPVHSGYDLSLPYGKPASEDSLVHSMPTEQGVYDEIPAEASVSLPTYQFRAPSYFNGPHLSYDPLGKTLPIPSTAGENLPVEEQKSTNNPIDVADDWDSASDNGGLESATENRKPVPAVQENTGIRLQNPIYVAHDWDSASSDSEKGDSGLPIEVTGDSNPATKKDDPVPVDNKIQGFSSENPIDIANDWDSASDKNEPIDLTRHQDVPVPVKNLPVPVKDLGPGNSMQNPIDISIDWSSESEDGIYEVGTSVRKFEKKPAGRSASTLPAVVVHKHRTSETEDEASVARLATFLNTNEDIELDDQLNNLTDGYLDSISHPRPDPNVPFINNWPIQYREENLTQSSSPSSFHIPAPDSNGPAFYFDGPAPDSDVPVQDSNSLRRFGPEDFKHLQDNMFEDDESELSEEDN